MSRALIFVAGGCLILAVVICLGAIWKNPGLLSDAKVAPPVPAASEDRIGRPAQPFIVKIDTTISRGAFPVVNGTTNLPDGTRLVVSVAGCNDDPRVSAEQHCPSGKTSPMIVHPYDANDGPVWTGFPEVSIDRYPGRTTAKGGEYAFDYVTVKGGRFVSDPWFRPGHKGLYEGTYIVSVMDGPDQPPDVQALFGGDDQDDIDMALSGPLVVSEHVAASPRLHLSAFTAKRIQYDGFFDVGSIPAGDPVPTRAVATALGADPYAADKIAQREADAAGSRKPNGSAISNTPR